MKINLKNPSRASHVLIDELAKWQYRMIHRIWRSVALGALDREMEFIKTKGKRKPTQSTPTPAQILVNILTSEFRPPFVREGLVKAKMLGDGSARIRIGRRDVSITKNGVVTGAGTCLFTPTTVEGT
jgi:hypothetical protein